MVSQVHVTGQLQIQPENNVSRLSQKPVSTRPGAHQDMAIRENPDVEVLLHDLVPACLQPVPEEGVWGPDTVHVGQVEEGGVAVR